MENKEYILLCSIWDRIGPFDMNRFTDRLILQKKVFILQEIGLDFGYRFGKYTYGPYCSRLASDGFKVNLKENSKNANKECIDEEFLVKLKELEKGHERSASWFELLGTIAYLRNKERKSKEEIKEQISKEKAYLFEEKLFDEAYKKLLELKVIN